MDLENTRCITEQGILFRSGSHQDEELPLVQELILLSDRMDEFVCVNSFLCVSLSRLLEDHDAENQVIARGARYCAESLQAQSAEMKVALERFRNRYLAEIEARSLDVGDKGKACGGEQ